jgi:hypothetical protein
MALLFFARDPGPANYLVAVYDLVSMPEFATGAAEAAMRELRAHLPAVVYGRGAGLDVWRRAKIGHALLDDAVDPSLEYPAKAAAFTRLLRDQNVSCVITGASDIDENTDRAFWAAARSLGIPSHAFLDHPASLDQRFVLRDGTQILPDRIYAPDEAYLSMLAKYNVPLDRVTVTGPIHAERLRRITRRGEEEDLLRSAWGAKEGDKVVLFASECIQEMAEAGRPRDYSEFAVLGSLTKSLESGEAVGPVAVRAEDAILVVRPHPRDRDGKYASWRAETGSRLRRVVSAEGAPERAILAADVVVGMDSSLLRDALALGRPVVSLVGADLRV